MLFGSVPSYPATQHGQVCVLPLEARKGPAWTSHSSFWSCSPRVWGLPAAEGRSDAAPPLPQLW